MTTRRIPTLRPLASATARPRYEMTQVEGFDSKDDGKISHGMVENDIETVSRLERSLSSKHQMLAFSRSRASKHQKRCSHRVCAEIVR
jgi:hypothetical protein